MPGQRLAFGGGGVDKGVRQHLPFGVDAQRQAGGGVLAAGDLDAPRGGSVLQQPAAAEQRARLFEAIGEIIERQLGGRVERHSTARLQLARRRYSGFQ